MGRISNVVLEARRRRVARYYVRGISSREIAKIENVRIRTVQRDISTIRDRVQDEVSGRDVLDYYARFTQSYDEIIRELWIKYSKCDDEKLFGIALGCLQSIAKAEREKIEAGQRLGLVFEAPKKLEILEEIQATYLDAIELEDDETAKRILERIRIKLVAGEKDEKLSAKTRKKLITR